MSEHNIDLIIPAAKFLPDNMNYAEKLPAIIYPINMGTVFDLLFEQYGGSVDNTYIMTYEGKDAVHKQLDSYSKQNVFVNDLEEMYDLGHTIYHGLLKSQSERVVINYADTIITENICEEVGDCYYFSKDYMSEKWTFFDERNGLLSKIYDKPSAYRNKQKKLFIGVFKFEHKTFLISCLEKAFKKPKDDMNSFYQAVVLYSEKYPMRSVITYNWSDIGHVEKYYEAKVAVESRTFNHIAIDKNRGILRKTSVDKEKFIGEIEWYLKLPTDLEYVRPRVYSYSTRYDGPYISMEYYAYSTLHELMLYGGLSGGQWRDIFKRLLFVIEDFSRYSVSDESIADSLKSMYLDKTLERIDRLRTEDSFKEFFCNEIIVNGKKYKNLNDVCDLIEQAVSDYLLDVSEFNIIHGDLCFTNIMIDRDINVLKLIDPRGSFGHYDIYGDRRYEIAKLLHSIDGKYDYIIKNKFKIKYENNRIDYVFEDNRQPDEILEVFWSVFKKLIGKDKRSIQIIEALLFLSMIPLHSEDYEQQLVMMGTGLSILDRYLPVGAER